MDAHWTELTWALYGLSYMVLGVAIAARSAAFPSSSFRTRLLCLAAFGILHAFYDWLLVAYGVMRVPLPFELRYTVEAVSFVPLCFFAAGWTSREANVLKVSIVLTAIASASIMLFDDDATYLQLAVHTGLSIPAGACAVYALLYDPVFRPNSKSSDLALRIAAVSLGVYTATQFILTRADYFPATLLSSGNFQALFGVSPFAVRVSSAVVFMSATLMLLGRFDEAMRMEAEKTHHEMNKALRLSEAKLADVLSLSPEGIVISDGEGRIEMFSAGAESIFGWRADEIIGKSVEILMPERFHGAHRVHTARFLHSPQPPLVKDSLSPATPGQPRVGRPEITGLRRNGEEFPMGASLSKIATPDGLMVTTIIRDISKQKAEQKELMDAKRIAEESSRAKSQFIANMSHELRTPLNAIIGFSELLMVDAFANRRAEYANLIHVSGEHLLNLINDILDLAKIEAGRFELRESQLSFSTLADDAVGMLVEKAKTSNVFLVSEVPLNLPVLYADGRALKQVLINLAGNALKFTPAGGKVSIFASIGTEGQFLFGVRDTGVGISEEDQSRLFKEFGQGRQDAFTGEKGTGLGLKIAKGLTLAHGGTIILQSKIGIGTTITVTLPASRVRAVAAA